MQLLDAFKARHRWAIDIFYGYLWDEYDEAAWRTPAHPKLNTLAWNVWHVARVEDAGVSRFVAQVPQLLDEGDWNPKLNLDLRLRNFGYQMTREQMLEVSEKVNLAALRDYFTAVGARTLTLIDDIAPETFAQQLSADEVSHVLFQEHAALAQSTDLVAIYSAFTRLEALYHFSMTHYFWHGGEVRTIQGMMRD